MLIEDIEKEPATGDADSSESSSFQSKTGSFNANNTKTPKTGFGRSQGNPAPTPVDSTRPGTCQPEFQCGTTPISAEIKCGDESVTAEEKSSPRADPSVEGVGCTETSEGKSTIQPQSNNTQSPYSVKSSREAPSGSHNAATGAGPLKQPLENTPQALD